MVPIFYAVFKGNPGNMRTIIKKKIPERNYATSGIACNDAVLSKHVCHQ